MSSCREYAGLTDQNHVSDDQMSQTTSGISTIRPGEVMRPSGLDCCSRQAQAASRTAPINVADRQNVPKLVA